MKSGREEKVRNTPPRSGIYIHRPKDDVTTLPPLVLRTTFPPASGGTMNPPAEALRIGPKELIPLFFDA